MINDEWKMENDRILAEAEGERVDYFLQGSLMPEHLEPACRGITPRAQMRVAFQLGLLAVVFAFAPPASAQYNSYRFDHWTTDNGLPQNTVYNVIQTRDGYLW